MATDDDDDATQTTWSARFGWITGAVLGTLLGFLATWGLEVRVLAGRVADAPVAAARASAVVVPALFLAGALSGHALGARGGGRRLRLLGASAGISIAAGLWVLLVVLR